MLLSRNPEFLNNYIAKLCATSLRRCSSSARKLALAAAATALRKLQHITVCRGVQLLRAADTAVQENLLLQQQRQQQTNGLLIIIP